MEPITAAGHTGQITFDGDFVTITRKGALARMTVGKGEKRIPLSSISAVQWKEPGGLVNGFIQFSIGGGNESKSRFGSQTTDAVKDENSVVIMKKHAENMRAVRAAVEAAIAERHRPAAPVGAPAPQASRLDRLQQLVALRDAGALSEEEFAVEKGRVMSEPEGTA